MQKEIKSLKNRQEIKMTLLRGNYDFQRLL